MGRPAIHRVTRDHPSPRFRGKVRLHCFLRGPADDGWAAQYLIDGKWLPRNSAALGTRDFDEACELARDKYTLAIAGEPITVPRATTKKTLAHAFGIYAERAIAKLEAQADEADASIVVGKGHKFRSHARRIKRDLCPRWSAADITEITEDALNEWIEREYRVEDVVATVKKYGRQPKGEGRQTVRKKPAVDTLGNLDQAFREVWLEAAADGVVDRKKRPQIDKTEHGEDGGTRAFIDAAGVGAVAHLMTDDWVTEANGGHNPALKYLTRCYLALAASSGIRPGMELERIKLGNIAFREQGPDRTPVIIIQVEKHQGKHKRHRPVVVYEADVFPIRRLLTDLIAYRRSQGATAQDCLFARPDGRFPTYKSPTRTVLTKADARFDPMTGLQRSAYSFRHYFATKLIELGLSVPQVADWLGTSSQMVEKHYNRFLTERNAHLVNGYDLLRAQKERQIEELRRAPWDADSDADLDWRTEEEIGRVG